MLSHFADASFLHGSSYQIPGFIIYHHLRTSSVQQKTCRRHLAFFLLSNQTSSPYHMPSVTVLVMVPMASSFTIDVIFSVRACKAWSSKLSSLKRTVHEASALFMSGPLVCQHVRFCRFFSRPQTWRKASNIIGASFGSYIVSLSQVVTHHTALLGHQSWHSCHVLPDISTFGHQVLYIKFLFHFGQIDWFVDMGIRCLGALPKLPDS